MTEPEVSNRPAPSGRYQRPLANPPHALFNPPPSPAERLNDARRRPCFALDPDMVAGLEKLGRRSGFIDGVLSFIPEARRVEVEAELWAAPDERAAAAIARREYGPRIAELKRESDAALTQRKHIERRLAAAEEILAWANNAMVLQSAETSALHQAMDPMLMTLGEEPPPEELQRAKEGCEVFLVQHDWASVLSGAEVDAGGYRLPSDLCCFEFMISGHRVCAVVTATDGEPYRLIPIFKTRVGWMVLKSYALSGDEAVPEWVQSAPHVPSEGDAAVRMILDQIRAIAITLDAEVVTREVVRAPHQLNAARIKRGERPLYDHHILTLSRRPRLAPMANADPGHTGGKRRLHFRRGHWRHYPNHKTWIKWMLVGDPDQGFADKDYRL